MQLPPKTVLLITPGGRTAPGGIARMVDYCVRAWAVESGFTLRVIDSYGPGEKWLMPFYALLAFVRVMGRLAIGRAQLLHINFSERLSVWRKGAFVLLAGLFRVPVILHLHGAEFIDYMRGLGPNRRRLAIGILRRARKIIVLGGFWRDFLVSELQLDPVKIEILCNAVPDVARNAERVPSESCRILFLGVIGERKGVPVLLNALADAKLASLKWHMTIAGNGEMEMSRQMAAGLGLAARVSFPGLLNETEARKALSEADIFVLPSRQEGLPMAILEALSYGCPVVATPVGSIPDAVVDGQTGILVPAGDAGALASALARLIADSAYRKTLGSNARRLFEEKFAIAAYNEKLAAIYNKALSRLRERVG